MVFASNQASAAANESSTVSCYKPILYAQFNDESFIVNLCLFLPFHPTHTHTYEQIDLTSPPLPPHNQYHHLQQQHHHQQQQHQQQQQQQSLMVASCQGNFQNTPTTNLNTLDRYPPPPSPLSPTMFISSSSNPPGLNEPVSFCYTVIYCVSTSLEHNFFSIFFILFYVPFTLCFLVFHFL